MQTCVQTCLCVLCERAQNNSLCFITTVSRINSPFPSHYLPSVSLPPSLCSLCPILITPCARDGILLQPGSLVHPWKRLQSSSTHRSMFASAVAVSHLFSTRKVGNLIRRKLSTIACSVFSSQFFKFDSSLKVAKKSASITGKTQSISKDFFDKRLGKSCRMHSVLALTGRQGTRGYLPFSLKGENSRAEPAF